jgi:hypothetical protein
MDTGTGYRANQLGVRLVQSGKTVDRFESQDLDSGIIDFTVFYSDGTHETITHSLVSDALIAIKSLQLSNDNLPNKLYVQRADTTMLFNVDTLNNLVRANLPIATGSVYQLVYNSGTKELSYLDTSSVNTVTGNQTITSSGTTTVAGNTSTVVGTSAFATTTTSILGTNVKVGNDGNTTNVQFWGTNIQVGNPADNSPATIIKTTAAVVAQIAPVQIVVSSPAVQSVISIFNVLRKKN